MTAGPYETEAEALAEPMPREVDALRTAGSDDHALNAGRLRDARSNVLRHLRGACETAGVALGAYDQHILEWLAGWAPSTAQVVIGLVTRANAGKLPAVEKVLDDLVSEYYEGCKAYAGAASAGLDNPTRVFWRIRLGALEVYGDKLAEALGTVGPDWGALRELAESRQEPVKPVLYPDGPCDGCGSPGPAGEACG